MKSEKSTGETTAYEWNDQGMLVKVILPNGEPVEYEYDGNQRLISRKSSDGVDNFVQSGWDIMTKMDDVGKRTYYTGSSAMESEDSVKYFHYNHRGDTVLVTDANGEILHNLNYEAYGKPTNSEGIPFNKLSIKDLPNLFVGASGIRYDTKTNLHYMRFRWFSSSQLRFISPDLLMDLNRYAYVSGNPINYFDLFGLWIVKIINARIIAIPEGKEGIVELNQAGYHSISNVYEEDAWKSKSFRRNLIGYDITEEFGPDIKKLLEEQERFAPGTGGRYNCWDLTFKFRKQQEYDSIDFTDPNYRQDDSIGIGVMKRIFGANNAHIVPTGLPANRRGKFDLVIFYQNFQNQPGTPYYHHLETGGAGNDNKQWNRFTHFGINLNLKNRASGKDYMLEKVGPRLPLQVGTIQDATNRCKLEMRGPSGLTIIPPVVVYRHL